MQLEMCFAIRKGLSLSVVFHDKFLVGLEIIMDIKMSLFCWE